MYDITPKITGHTKELEGARISPAVGQIVTKKEISARLHALLGHYALSYGVRTRLDQKMALGRWVWRSRLGCGWHGLVSVVAFGKLVDLAL